MTIDRDAVLQRTRRRLVDRWGMKPVNTLEDRGGIHCVVMKHDGEQFYVVAKEQVWEDTASFLQKTTRRAADYESALCCYFVDEDDYYVFDAEYVLETGRESEGKSKTHMTTWFEVPLNDGATLDDYVHQRSTPETLGQTRTSTLRRFEQ